MGNIVRVEVDKLGKYEVMDKFDLDYVAKQNNISLAGLLWQNLSSRKRQNSKS